MTMKVVKIFYQEEVNMMAVPKIELKLRDLKEREINKAKKLDFLQKKHNKEEIKKIKKQILKLKKEIDKKEKVYKNLFK
jgi:hypothetical protein